MRPIQRQAIASTFALRNNLIIGVPLRARWPGFHATPSLSAFTSGFSTQTVRFTQNNGSRPTNPDKVPFISNMGCSRLQGKNVLITGASSGIGEACARHFAQAGSNLLLSARRKDRLDKLKQELEAQHPEINISTFQLDVRDRAQVKATALTFGNVDVLVNNAGLVIGLDKLEDITEEAMDTMIDTNVKGLVHVTQSVLPGMRARNKGHIINIGSVAGQQAYANGSIYCASKAAVASITKALLYETVDTAIRISEINPGMVETEFSVVRFGGDKDKAESVYKGLQPLDGNDIAETVVFVAGRPEHVNIAEMLVFPTHQAAATTVHRTRQ